MKEAGSKRRNSAQCTRNDHCVRRKKKSNTVKPATRKKGSVYACRQGKRFSFLFPLRRETKGKTRKEGQSERVSEPVM